MYQPVLGPVIGQVFPSCTRTTSAPRLESMVIPAGAAESGTVVGVSALRARGPRRHARLEHCPHLFTYELLGRAPVGQVLGRPVVLGAVSARCGRIAGRSQFILDGSQQRAEMGFDDLPDQVQPEVEVTVSSDIPKPVDSAPRDIGVAVPNALGEPAWGLG